MFPPAWRIPGDWSKTAHEIEPSSLDQIIKGSPVLLIVTYDPRKRAHASEGDVLGFMSLGCVMENMWLMVQALGIDVHVLSTFGGGSVEIEVKRVLEIPEYMRIAFAVRLGYPVAEPPNYLRVRRDVEEFTHHNRFSGAI